MEIEDILLLNEEQIKEIVNDYLITTSDMKRRAVSFEDIAKIGKYTFEDHLSLYGLKNGEIIKGGNYE